MFPILVMFPALVMFPTLMMARVFVLCAATAMVILIATGPSAYATPASEHDGKQAQHNRCFQAPLFRCNFHGKLLCS